MRRKQLRLVLGFAFFLYCERDLARADGESGKELRKFGFGMVRYVWPRFTGSRRTE